MKKGFTLIELLAVILILGIIALIAVPQVTNVIENANKGALETTGEHYLSAFNTKIGLNKLDTDSSNDIKNGYVDINTVEVDMTGEKPTSGKVFIYNGNVVDADLEVNGKKVICDKNGKCTVIDKYVYYNGPSKGIAEISEGQEEKPSAPSVYLRYPVINRKLQTPQVCLSADDSEICISPGEDQISRKKILSYFDFVTEEELINNPNVVYYVPVYKSKSCMYYDVVNNGFYCNSAPYRLGIGIQNDGAVYIVNITTLEQWRVYNDGNIVYIKS